MLVRRSALLWRSRRAGRLWCVEIVWSVKRKRDCGQHRHAFVVGNQYRGISDRVVVAPDRVQQVGSSPLISVSAATGVYMIDPYTGAIRFDSKAAGVHDVKEQKVL